MIVGVPGPGARGGAGRGDESIDPAQERELEALRATDARVRRHEEAHRAAAGPLYRGGPTYTYQTGPDGKRYAVAGSVRIDTSPGRTPQETLIKAAAIRRAALAPLDPSPTDRAIAAKAARMEAAARRALAKEAMQRDAGSATAAGTRRTQPPPRPPEPTSPPEPPLDRPVPRRQASALPAGSGSLAPGQGQPDAAAREPMHAQRNRAASEAVEPAPTDQGQATAGQANAPADRTVQEIALGMEVWASVSELAQDQHEGIDRIEPAPTIERTGTDGAGGLDVLA